MLAKSVPWCSSSRPAHTGRPSAVATTAATARLPGQPGEDVPADRGVVPAEHLVVHPNQRLGSRLVDDVDQLHARRRRHVEREVGDVRDQQGLLRLARQSGRDQPLGQVGGPVE